MKKIASAIFLVAVLTISASAQNPHKSLFDGRDLTRHWVMPGFRVSEGVIITDSPDGAGRNLFTRQQYGNFTLRFEYFLSHLGNSGAKQVLFDIIAGATRPDASHSEKSNVAQALKRSLDNCTSETTAEYLKWLLGMVEVTGKLAVNEIKYLKNIIKETFVDY